MCDAVVLQSLDADKSGTVTLEELKEGLAQQGSQVTQRELQALVDSMDIDKNGSIDYDEFLAATINMSQLQVPALLRAVPSPLHGVPTLLLVP